MTRISGRCSRHILVLSGYSVVPTERATDGIEAVRTFTPDLTLIDISMPGMDGFTAARRIREISNTHLVIVSGRAEEIDVVQGFAAGADDYVFKPFRVRELRARLEARVQRALAGGGSSAAPAVPAPASASSGTAASSPALPGSAPPKPAPAGTPPWHPTPAQAEMDVRTTPTDTPATPTTAPATDAPTFERVPLAVVVPTELSHGTLTLNRETHEVHLEGRPVQLTDKEFTLLATLMEHGHRVRSTSSLVLAMRGESYVTASFVTAADRGEVAAQIQSLRRKLGDSELAPKWIETVRDVGYRRAAL